MHTPSTSTTVPSPSVFGHVVSCTRLREKTFYVKPVSEAKMEQHKITVDKTLGTHVRWGADVAASWASATELLGWE